MATTRKVRIRSADHFRTSACRSSRRAKRQVIAHGGRHADPSTQLSRRSSSASGGSGGSFGVALTVSEPAVTVAVTDSGSCVTTPEVQCPASDSTHGRGLAMVTALADSVTVQGGAEGRTVTAELLTQVRPGSPTPCSARPGDRRP
ncbi:ATP-binding protein [Streptomyces sp. GMY01]|uniref:ATP-binding protein n=1 Tax=Streptomyces sp. GMY02 TaxID=1333528 RepID=UPI00146BBAC1|nr:ATP-binding protein [Streptomyces sp. GMY02]